MLFDLYTLHGWLRLGHILPGFIGLIVFWIPVVSRKGGKLHRTAGKVFEICCGSVAITAIIASLWMLISPATLEPNLNKVDAAAQAMARNNLAFIGSLLGTLAYATLVPLILSRYWLKSKRNPLAIQSMPLKVLVLAEILLCILLAVFSIYQATNGGGSRWWFLLGLAAAGGSGARKHWHDVSRAAPLRMQWWYRHMEYMLTTGIAFHTAFLVFGASRFIGEIFTGSWALLPWLAPTIIGVPATMIWVRYYKIKFKDRPSEVVA